MSAPINKITPELQEKIDKMTLRQRLFCQEYIIDFNGAQAAIRAGYQSDYPEKMAYQNLKLPQVVAHIKQLIEAKNDQVLVKPEFVIRKVMKAIEVAERENNHTAVLKGCELLARHLGMFIERKEISGPNGDPIKYEQVREAADAFTSAIHSIIDRDGAGPTPFEITR